MGDKPASCAEDLNEGLLKEVARRLVSWWKIRGRRYPWRESRDPYRVFIAEVMLHRTRADQVAPIYIRFIERYPTVNDLATADLKDLEDILYPLGLRWRWRFLLETARRIVRVHGGEFPRAKEDLLSLPGVGEYISAAVRIFAFNERDVLVDANIARILGRVVGIKVKSDLRRDRCIRRVVQRLIEDVNNLRELYYALIDLGGDTCRSRDPKCEICPLKDVCRHATRGNDGISTAEKPAAG